MERLVVVVTARAALDGRVHVVAEERPGAPDVDAEREECTQYDNDAKVTVALRTGAPKHEHEAPRDGAHVTTSSYYSSDRPERIRRNERHDRERRALGGLWSFDAPRRRRAPSSA